MEIKPFIENYLYPNGMYRPYDIGTVFYRLDKPEKVQESKILMVRDLSTLSVYAGKAARDLIGFPHIGDHRLYPGHNKNYEIYVQSKSTNRKLFKGTRVIYWKNTLL